MRTGHAARTVNPPCLEVMRDAKNIQKDALDDPLLDKKGELDTRALMPTDLNEGNLYTGDGTKVHRGHRRKHRESESQSNLTGAVRNVVGIIIGVISEKLIIAYYAASSNG